jgi:hypothetical protein
VKSTDPVLDENDALDEIDPAVWPLIVERLRRMKTVEEDEDFEDPDPFV